MIKIKVSRVLRRIVVILLITIFTIAGIIACSGDAITGSGGRRGYTSETDGGGSTDNPDNPDNPNVPGDTNIPGGDTNATGGNTNAGGDTPPSLPNDNPGDYYDLRVPFVVKTGFTNVSYKDTNKLKQLWFDQINRKGMNDGKVFAIRNKANNRDANNFQKRHTHGKYSAQDYYYFNENGDIVWKEDNNIIKKFMGAIIVRYRDVSIERGKKLGFYNNLGAIISISWSERKQNGKPLHTVGGLYANTMTTKEAKAKYLLNIEWQQSRWAGPDQLEHGDDPFKEGVFDFVAFRHNVETYHDGWNNANNLFERQYIERGFLEVLVMADYYYSLPSGCAAVHSYYPYSGKFNYHSFTSQNMPYMTNHNIYLSEKPEWVMNQLTGTAEFTDAHFKREWCYLFMPGTPDSAGRSVSINPIPTW